MSVEVRSILCVLPLSVALQSLGKKGVVQDEIYRWVTINMKRIFRGRLSRSSSKGRVIETAFVSQTRSSTEDLDEVDRLANHPVLRPSNTHDNWPRLRKSRSETGGSVEQGLAPWTFSNQSSPLTADVATSTSIFGSRIVGVSMFKKRNKKPVSRMKRSYTVDFAAAQADELTTPNNRRPSPTPSPSIDEEEEVEDIGVPIRRPSNHLVRAIIESRHHPVADPRECVTPPPNVALLRRDDSNQNINRNEDSITTVEEDEPIKEPTPPNTAPLPTKFGCKHPPPHNLLRLQLQKKSLIDCDTSSAASTEATEGASTLNPQPKFKLSLPLKQRLLLVDSSQDDSSSADSTPQRRKAVSTASYPAVAATLSGGTQLALTNRPPSKSQATVLAATSIPSSSSMHQQTQRPKPSAPLLSRKMGKLLQQHHNLSGESESCSSAMSSMESVRSSNSGDSLVSSSESGAGLSASSHSNSNLSIPSHFNKPTLELRTHRSNILSSSKFQVLSPISDKSQEQSSEQGDSNSRTPKVSPTDHILTSCCGGGTEMDDNENNNDKNNVPAPFSMPKLHRRLVAQQQLTQPSSYQTSLLKRANRDTGIQGSDSGISMSSQDVQDMVELLKLPFDMPKLRRKTQHFLARPQSLPASENCPRVDDNRSSNSSYVGDDWPGPNPTAIETGSTMDNYQHLNTELTDFENNKSSGSTFFGGKKRQQQLTGFPFPVAPASPPPGFADENNQFYLTENSCEEMAGATMTEASAGSLDAPMQKLSIRRRRPQMTLSFGVDPKQKSLMFTTESPFLLNDCQDIDPALPLERQEWYHGGITKDQGVDLLRSQEEGSYLVRKVDPLRQEFSLILKSPRGFMHLRIKRDASSREFQLSDFARKFLTIPEMIHHYTRNRLPIKGAEHMCLKKPVAIQLL